MTYERKHDLDLFRYKARKDHLEGAPRQVVDILHYPLSTERFDVIVEDPDRNLWYCTIVESLQLGWVRPAKLEEMKSFRREHRDFVRKLQLPWKDLPEEAKAIVRGDLLPPVKTFTGTSRIIKRTEPKAFDENTAPSWIVGSGYPASTMCGRWFWYGHVLKLEVGQSIDTDFQTIRRET